MVSDNHSSTDPIEERRSIALGYITSIGRMPEYVSNHFHVYCISKKVTLFRTRGTKVANTTRSLCMEGL